MGLLITVEGGEYVGKSSVAVPGLQRVLEDCGIPVRTSREPGGTPEGERIRAEILRSVSSGTDQHHLAVLFNKARRIHLETVIKPYLGEHKQHNVVMLLDRYIDSTRVYQGLEGKLGLEAVYELEKEYVEGFLPDLTFILFLPEKQIEKLILARQKIVSEYSGDRAHTAWDDVSLETHRERQQRYLSLAELARKHGESRVFEHIDASLPPLEVISVMARRTMRFIRLHNHLTVPSDFESCLLKSMSQLRYTPLHIHLERQWKRQQHLLATV